MRNIEEAIKSDVLQADEVRVTLNHQINESFQKFMDHKQVQILNGAVLYYKRDVSRFIELLIKMEENF